MSQELTLSDLQAVIEKNPLEWSDEELETIVKGMRELRQKFTVAKAKARGIPTADASQIKLEDLGDLTL